VPATIQRAGFLRFGIRPVSLVGANASVTISDVSPGSAPRSYEAGALAVR
jgi:hypothetical protein